MNQMCHIMETQKYEISHWLFMLTFLCVGRIIKQAMISLPKTCLLFFNFFSWYSQIRTMGFGPLHNGVGPVPTEEGLGLLLCLGIEKVIRFVCSHWAVAGKVLYIETRQIQYNVPLLND